MVSSLFNYDFLKNVFSDWKPYMADIFCKKNGFLFKLKKKLLIKLVVQGTQRSVNLREEFGCLQISRKQILKDFCPSL